MTRHILLESLYVTVHEPTSGVRPAATERNARTFLREALALAGDVDAEGGHRSSRDGRTDDAGWTFSIRSRVYSRRSRWVTTDGDGMGGSDDAESGSVGTAAARCVWTTKRWRARDDGDGGVGSSRE